MAELPAKAERWRQLGYSRTPVIATGGWLWRSSDATRQARAARINSSLPNGAAPSPAGVASAPAPVVPTRKRRSNHPPSTTGVLCKWFDDRTALIRIRHPRRRACWPATPASKSRSWRNVRRSPRRAPSRACGAPNAFMHVPSPWYRVYESKAAQLALSKRRRQAAARQGDDGKLVPRRRWQTADRSGSGPVTCE